MEGLETSAPKVPSLTDPLPSGKWAAYNAAVKLIQDTYYGKMQALRAEADRRDSAARLWLNGELALARAKYDGDILAARKSVLEPVKEVIPGEQGP